VSSVIASRPKLDILSTSTHLFSVGSYIRRCPCWPSSVDENDPHTHTATLSSAISHSGSTSRSLSFGMIASYGIAYLWLQDASLAELFVQNHRSRILPSLLWWTTMRRLFSVAKLTWLFRH